MTKLSDATRNKLKTVSTATVATALFKRGFRVQMIQDVHPLGPEQPVLVGEAFTLRYMPAREDLNKIEVFYAGKLTERRNGAVVRDLTTLETETGDVYVVAPVPASVQAAIKPTRVCA